MLDVRYGFEYKVWGLPFTCNIPLNELPDRLNELPKDKIIVCACPEAVRSNIIKQYLTLKGYNAKFLSCGMIALMERLKIGKAKDIVFCNIAVEYLLYFGVTVVISTLFSIGGTGSSVALIPVLGFLGVGFDLAKTVGLFANTASTIGASVK